LHIKLLLKTKKAQDEACAKPKDNNLMQITSTNQIVQPNLPTAPLPISSFQFYKNLARRVFNHINTVVVQPIRVRNYLRKKKFEKKGISNFETRTMAEDIFIKYHNDFLIGKIDKMREYCSESLLKQVTQELQKRPKMPTVDVLWECKILHTKIISYNLVTLPSPISLDFVQIVFSIKSEQNHKIIEKNSQKEVGGSKVPEVVTVYWGFEKQITKPDCKWILVEKLTINK